MQANSPEWYPPSYSKKNQTNDFDSSTVDEWFKVVAQSGTICKDFVLGKCERSRCHYEHPHSLGGLRWKDGTQVCVADLFGETCRRGKRCSFFHPSTQTIPFSEDRIRRSRRGIPQCTSISSRCDTLVWWRQEKAKKSKKMQPIGSPVSSKTRTVAIQTDPIVSIVPYSLFDGPSLFAHPVVS